MIYMSHIKELYTCDASDELSPKEFIDPAPHARAAQTLNKSLNYWETYWMVKILPGKYMADVPVLNTVRDEPTIHLGKIPGTEFPMRPYQEWRAYPEKQPPAILAAQVKFERDPACLDMRHQPGSSHYTNVIQHTPKAPNALAVQHASRDLPGGESRPC